MAAQIACIEQMIEKGYDVTEAKELLRQMRRSSSNSTPGGGSFWTHSPNPEPLTETGPSHNRGVYCSRA
jgi:hypothetical protein